MKKMWYLERIKLFQSLNKEQLHHLHDLTHMYEVPKNTLVQLPKNNPNGIFFIKKGKLKVYTLSEEGKQFTLGIMSTGKAFGQTRHFSLGTEDFYIESMEVSLICKFEESGFNQFVENNPPFLLEVLGQLSQTIKEQNIMLEQLANHNVEHRLIFWLCKLSVLYGIQDGNFLTIDFNLSHQELANMIGSSRETVSAMLKLLVKKDMLKMRRMRISVHKHLIDDFQKNYTWSSMYL